MIYLQKYYDINIICALQFINTQHSLFCICIWDVFQPLDFPYKYSELSHSLIYY